MVDQVGKPVDDRKTVIYRFQRSYQDLVGAAGEEKIHEPLVDICETKTHLRLEVELPGVQKNDIELYTIGEKLFIHAYKKEGLIGDDEPGKREFLCLERQFGEFYREVELLVPCNRSEGKASFEDGVLIIVLPKVEDRRGVRQDLTIE